ncbi:MAG: hypothetical protein Q8M24_09400 [Pseudolabrys sp.]|nr:hypothetical protein [Pseudolabrys sp.]
MGLSINLASNLALLVLAALLSAAALLATLTRAILLLLLTWLLLATLLLTRLLLATLLLLTRLLVRVVLILVVLAHRVSFRCLFASKALFEEPARNNYAAPAAFVPGFKRLRLAWNQRCNGEFLYQRNED